MTDDILAFADVSQPLKVAEKTVYTTASKGGRPARMVGGRWRFERDDIDASIERQKQDLWTVPASPSTSRP